MTRSTSDPLLLATRPDTLAKGVAMALAGTVLITLAARAQVPMWPVPMTLQTLAVMVIGLSYGARLGTATLLLYLVQGAIGLPVFASGGGLAYFAGPTTGYLVGFVLAAGFLGWAADRGITQRVSGLAGSIAAATVLVFAPGFIWLAVFIGPSAAWASGVLPFLPGAVVKGAMVALIVKGAAAYFRRT